ncbi:MAG: flagellar basal-body MS-ring/collar protein FliF [Mycobacteriales bacterium]
MPAQLSKLPQSLRTLLAGFTAGQKAVTAIALVALLIGGAVFTSWAAKPSMVPVFTNLAAGDAAAITEELSTRGTKYQLAAGGSTILVPQKDVYQLRLDLSAAGLPQDGKSGYELLDSQGITTSEFRQRVDFQRALEGELTKTITSIEGVEAATVHLVMPEEALFSEDARKPSASVLVKTKPGKNLTGGQVQAVVNLVSSSVEGLTPDQVTLADANGTVLSAAGEDGANAAAGDARAVQTAAFEKELQTSVQEMLTPIVGSGKAVVRVKAALDFDKRATTSERFNPEDKQAPAVNESVTTEKYEGGGQIVGGVLGPENVNNPALAGGDSTYEKGQESRTLAVDKVTEQVQSAPGKVERLSVAVVLDAEAAGVIAPAEIEQLVAAAAGIDRERGDVVEVSRMAFDETAANAAAEEFAKIEAAEQAAERANLIRTVGVLLVVGLLLLYALRVMRRDQRTEVELPYDIVATQIDADAAEAAALAAAAERRALEPPPLSVEDRQRIHIQGEIGELVERQPEEVAQLLRGWLADRRS